MNYKEEIELQAVHRSSLADKLYHTKQYIDNQLECINKESLDPVETMHFAQLSSVSKILGECWDSFINQDNRWGNMVENLLEEKQTKKGKKNA